MLGLELCHLLRIAVPTQWSRNRTSTAQEMTKFNLGPNILKAHEMELFSSRPELWLRKAANVKEKNLMAFQGR